MKVVNPNNTSHEIIIIPRQYTYTDLVLELYNEETQESETVTNTFQTVDGLLTIGFDYDFIDGQKFQIKITEDSDVLYRGKLFVTTQNTQTFKASNNLYYYE